MLKNRILRWMSIASCALLLCTNANATERFADDGEAFKTYGEVCGKIDQIQSLNVEFSDVDKAREYCKGRRGLTGRGSAAVFANESLIMAKAKIGRAHV